MNKVDVIRALRDEEYRSGLSEAERALLPDHPAGLVELSTEQISSVSGANPWATCIDPQLCSTVNVSCVPPGVWCP